MARRNESINTDNLIKAYIGGQSIKQLAIANNVSRQVIYRILRENNIAIRNRSESMFNRMAQTSFAEKQRLTHSANVARRNIKPSDRENMLKAIAAEKLLYKAGEGEKEVLDFLTAKGYKPIWQKAFKSYNFDIAVGNVAVEISVDTGNPLKRPHNLKKVVECTKFGWNFLFIWCKPHKIIFCDTTYNNIIAFIDACNGNPTSIGQYRVIRSNGEFYTAGSFND